MAVLVTSRFDEHPIKNEWASLETPFRYSPLFQGGAIKIENMNDIKFNVFGVDDKQSIYPLYISNKIYDKTCNLLLIENHYVCIKDFNKLMNTAINYSFVIIVCNI